MDARRIAKLTKPGAVKRILVRGTNWIGDAVLTTPALMAIRKGFPQAKIALLVKPAIAELLHHHPAVDEIVLYRDPGPHAGLGGKLTLARLLRRGRYDLAILLQNAFEAAAITALAGGTVCRGGGSGGRRAWWRGLDLWRARGGGAGRRDRRQDDGTDTCAVRSDHGAATDGFDQTVPAVHHERYRSHAYRDGVRRADGGDLRADRSRDDVAVRVPPRTRPSPRGLLAVPVARMPHRPPLHAGDQC